jgi:hypothetical protein
VPTKNYHTVPRISYSQSPLRLKVAEETSRELNVPSLLLHLSIKPLGTLLSFWELENTMTEKYNLIIVGGGPVGLFLGLSLSLKNIRVLVIDKEQDIPKSPKALM